MKSWRRYSHSALLLCFTALFSVEGIAQTVRIVNGSIPIPFAHCQNLRTSAFSFSDGEGVMELPERGINDTLEFRSLGFENRIVLPGESIGSKIALYENPIGIDAVLISSNISPDMARREGLKVVDKLQLTSVVTGKAPGKSTDLLSNTGQVLVQQSQQGGGSPIIRGFEANRILLVVDGVRMNNAIYRSGHLQNAITVDANALEQVQVVMGPSSVSYGSDALGGVIHFQTHRPKFRRDDLEDTWSGVSSASYRTNNSATSFHTRVEGGGEKWASIISFSNTVYGDLRMGENRMHGDSIWGLMTHYVGDSAGVDVVLQNDDPSLQIGSGYSQKDFMHKTRFSIPGGAISTNFQYSISSNISRFDKLNDPGIEPGSLKWARWDYGPQKRLLGAVSWEQYLGLPGSLHTTFAYQNIEESRIKRRFGASNEEVQNENVDVLSMSSVWHSSPFRGDGWRFLLGVDGQWNGVTSTSDSSATVTRYPNSGSTMLNLGTFASARRNFGGKVLHGGIRYNYSAIDAYYNLDFASIDLPFTEMHSANGAFTGSVALEQPVVGKLMSNTSLSSGFRSPNIDDAAKIREKNGFIIIPNDSISPEYIYSFDQSLTYTPFIDKSKLSLTAAGFVSLWADAIVPTIATINGDATIMYEGENSIVQMNQNANNAFVTGARFEFKSQLNTTSQLSGTINFTEGHIILGGAKLSHIPPVFGRVGFLNQGQGWSVETFVLFNGAKDISMYGDPATDNLAEALSTGTPAWWTLNVESQFELSETLRAQVGVSNLLDMHYKPFSSGISAPGRGVFIALNANF